MIGRQAKLPIGRQARILDYVERYNHQRPHSSLNRKTPHQAYNDWLPTLKRAA